MSLPILEIEREFAARLAGASRLILEAPTGSGKSTQVPQFLLRGGFLEGGQAVVLQPRRIAARLLAKRVSWEIGEPLGGKIGYQVRHESRLSRDTKVRFVTEGMLLRQMIADPELKGVSCIVFDEFHERSLNADLTLARALMLQRSKRPDLKLVVMSATLDASGLASYLAPCEILRSEGRVYPVDIRYLDNRTFRSEVPVWELAARQVELAVASQPEGHALVFMPGAFEIGRTMQALREKLSSREFEILPLHSELSPQDQDRAVEGGSLRKVIVATNVAETSLTIDNVRIVVDSGQARIARYDPNRGINTLWIEKISDASAKQRAGRAGRTAPGVAIRLWTEREHAGREAFEAPEVRRVDLSEMILSLLATGVEGLEGFEWFERPSEERLGDAVSLLKALGALNREGRLTARGRLMSSFPVHPRYAAMLIAARDFGCVEEVTMAAALAQSKSILLRQVDKQVERRRADLLGEGSGSDLVDMLHLWEAARRQGFDIGLCRDLGIHAQTARQVGQIANQLFQYAEASGFAATGGALSAASDEALRKCLLLGFPDRVCRRLDRGTLRCAMVGGRRADLARESRIGEAAFFVACEVNEIGGQQGSVRTVLNVCTAINLEWLQELFPHLFHRVEETVFDEKQKRVVERRLARFQDLELEAKENLDVEPSRAAAALARLVIEGKARLEKWDDAVEDLIRKVAFLAKVFPEYEIEGIDEESRELLYEQCCEGAKSLRDLKRQEVLPVVKAWIGRTTLALVEAELPERLRLANGRQARLRVDEERVTLSAKIQDLYDVTDTPRLCQGRVSPRIELLAPNMRPIQLTDDLGAFWGGSYHGIKKELKGRYPKHEWR